MLTFTFTLTVFPSTCLGLSYCYCVLLYFLFLPYVPCLVAVCRRELKSWLIDWIKLVFGMETSWHTHTRLTALSPGLPRWAGTRKIQPVWILLKFDTEWQCHQLGCMQVGARCNRASTPPLSFLQTGCPLSQTRLSLSTTLVVIVLHSRVWWNTYDNQYELWLLSTSRSTITLHSHYCDLLFLVLTAHCVVSLQSFLLLLTCFCKWFSDVVLGVYGLKAKAHDNNLWHSGMCRRKN